MQIAESAEPAALLVCLVIPEGVLPFILADQPPPGIFLTLWK